MSNGGPFQQEEVDIVGHSVKPDSVELLYYFYPNFKHIDTNVMIVDSPVVYTGPTDYLNRIKEFGYPVISATTLGQYDLTDSATLVNMTFTKWHQSVPKLLAKYVDKLPYDEILEAVKIHWLTGKWPIKKYNRSGAFLTLAESFVTDTHNVLFTYLTLIQNKWNTGAYMEKSIFSFLCKIVSGASNNSPWYNKILRQYRNNKKHLLQQAVDKYTRVSIWNKDLKVFNLLQDLNRLDRQWSNDQNMNNQN